MQHHFDRSIYVVYNGIIGSKPRKAVYVQLTRRSFFLDLVQKMLSKIAAYPGYLEFRRWLAFSEMICSYKPLKIRNFGVLKEFHETKVRLSTWN